MASICSIHEELFPFKLENQLDSNELYLLLIAWRSFPGRFTTLSSSISPSPLETRVLPSHRSSGFSISDIYLLSVDQNHTTALKMAPGSEDQSNAGNLWAAMSDEDKQEVCCLGALGEKNSKKMIVRWNLDKLKVRALSDDFPELAIILKLIEINPDGITASLARDSTLFIKEGFKVMTAAVDIENQSDSRLYRRLPRFSERIQRSLVRDNKMSWLAITPATVDRMIRVLFANVTNVPHLSTVRPMGNILEFFNVYVLETNPDLPST